jgi:NADP-dependent 3-hydroxy acid dehydrogenase YdfG
MSSKSPVVLITGGSSGFGHLVAQKLLAQSYVVYPAARRLANMEDLRALGARPIKLDVQDDRSVQEAVDRVIAEQGRIDVLFNNAGYGNYGLIECVAMEDIQRQFDVNVFGYVRMVKAVLPHMRAQRAGRIINTSSVVAHISIAGIGWYAASKHAVKAMSEALRAEVRRFGIDVIEIEPGMVATGFQAVAHDMADAVRCPADYAEFNRQVVAFQLKSHESAVSPESTANAVVEAIKAAKPKAVYRTTTDAKLAPLVRNALGGRAFGNIVLRQIVK